MSKLSRLLVPVAASVVAFLAPACVGLSAQVAAAPLGREAVAPPGKAPQAPLQFTSAGHVLGFSPDGVVAAAPDHLLKVDFVGARLVAPESTTPGRQAAPPLHRVTYRDAWEGVSVVYEAHPGVVAKSTYHVAAGASAQAIRLHYNRPVHLDTAGNLVVAYARGTLTEAAPVAWQEIDGRRVPVAVKWQSLSGTDVGFQVGPHDPRMPLTIDPILTWNTFLGGAGADEAQAIAVGGDGCTYITGKSGASWGTLPNRAYTSGLDAFVAKLNANGSLAWNTFLGGAGDDLGTGIALDPSGNVYVCGQSSSTWGSAGGFGSGSDLFIVKLNSSGVLQWHTFLGATGALAGRLALGSGSTPDVVVTGSVTAATGSPLRIFTEGATRNAVVAKLDNNGTYQWHTYLGGAGDHYGKALAVDPSGNILFAGTSSATWGSPVTLFGAGGPHACVARLAPGGSLSWNTFLGVGTNDQGSDVATDADGNVYLAGQANATWGSPLRVHAGGLDALVAKLGPDGTPLWHTFLGSASDDRGCAITRDTAGNLFIAGDSAASWGTPTRAFDTATDAFAAMLDTTGTLVWNTFLGGSGSDHAYGAALLDPGMLYVAGTSGATWGSPVGAFQGATDAFVAKLVHVDLTLTASPVSPVRTGTSVTFTPSATGGGLTYEYAFYWYDTATSSFKLRQDFEVGTTWTPDPVLAPSAVGRKTLLVYARQAGSGRPYDALAYLEYVVAPAAADKVTLTSSPDTTAVQGTPVVFTADASASASYANYSAHYQYQFLTSYDDGATWSVKQNWSYAKTWTMPATTPLTPTKGAYKVKVNVRTITSGGMEVADSKSFTLTAAHEITVSLTASPATSAAFGSTVTFTATGGGASAPFYYQFWFYNGTRWDMVQEWSTTATWNLPTSTPEGSAYKVQVRASKIATGPWEAYADLPYQVVTAATGLTVTPSASSPHIQGSPVTFRATATGGSPTYYYAFYLSSNGGTDWTVLQDWSTVSSAILPGSTVVGDYKIRVDVRTSAAGYDQRKEVDYKIISPSGTVQLAAVPGSPKVQGTAVTFTASVDSPPEGASFQYQFWRSYNDELSWVLKQDWSATNSWLMPSTTPLTPDQGPWKIRVDVRIVGETTVYATATIPFLLTPAATLSVTLTGNPATSCVVGSTATFTAVASGGDIHAPYYYQFWFYTGSRWDMIPVEGVTHGWSTKNTYVLPDTTPAGTKYKVQVRASQVPIETIQQLDWQAYANLSYTVRVLPATGLTVTASKPSPQYEGTTGIVFTATASGGGTSPTYEYAFYWYNETLGTYELKQGYSTVNTWTLPSSTPVTTPNHSTLLVYARTSSLVAFDVTSYTAYQIAATKATSVTLVSNKVGDTAVQGTAVTFTAAGVPTDIPSYQYQFWLSFDNGATWTLKQDYSLTTTWVMPGSTPLTPTGIAHLIKVNVRSSSAATVPDASTTLAFLVTVPPPTTTPISVSLSANPPNHVTVGSPATFTATASGGTLAVPSGTPTPEYLYQFWVYNGTRWDMVPVAGVSHGWSTKNTYVLPDTTPVGSAYKIQVRITQVPLASVTSTSWQAWANLSYAVVAPGYMGDAPGSRADVPTRVEKQSDINP